MSLCVAAARAGEMRFAIAAFCGLSSTDDATAPGSFERYGANGAKTESPLVKSVRFP